MIVNLKLACMLPYFLDYMLMWTKGMWEKKSGLKIRSIWTISLWNKSPSGLCNCGLSN